MIAMPSNAAIDTTLRQHDKGDRSERIRQLADMQRVIDHEDARTVNGERGPTRR